MPDLPNIPVWSLGVRLVSCGLLFPSQELKMVGQIPCQVWSQQVVPERCIGRSGEIVAGRGNDHDSLRTFIVAIWVRQFYTIFPHCLFHRTMNGIFVVMPCLSLGVVKPAVARLLNQGKHRAVVIGAGAPQELIPPADGQRAGTV